MYHPDDIPVHDEMAIYHRVIEQLEAYDYLKRNGIIVDYEVIDTVTSDEHCVTLSVFIKPIKPLMHMPLHRMTIHYSAGVAFEDILR